MRTRGRAQYSKGSAEPECDSELLTLVAEANASELEKRAAKLAIENEEFRQRVLGGRLRSVYVLDDPHRLLSEAIVLKRNRADVAEREFTEARSLAVYLRRQDADPLLKVAWPMALVPLDKDSAVLAMKHVKGTELGSAVVRSNRAGSRPPLDKYTRAIDFLAWFHAWAWRKGSSEPRRPVALLKVATSIAASWKRLGFGSQDSNLLRELLVEVLPKQAIHVRKKDAHPENWLVGPRGEVALLDLESTAPLPVYYDLAQLLDDYPLCTVDAGGMLIRAKLVDQYKSSLARRIPEIRDELMAADPWPIVCGFVLYRAAFGLVRLSRAMARGDATSSSALRSFGERRLHYEQLATWFIENAPTTGIGQCATQIAGMAAQS